MKIERRVRRVAGRRRRWNDPPPGAVEAFWAWMLYLAMGCLAVLCLLAGGIGTGFVIGLLERVLP